MGEVSGSFYGRRYESVDRDRIRDEQSAIRSILDHAPSDKRLEQLKEIYLTAIKEAAELESEGGATLALLIWCKNASSATVKLGLIAEKCAHAKERAIAARRLYYDYAETGEKLDDSSVNVLGDGFRYVFRKAASIAAASVLAAHGVPHVLAQFLGNVIGRAISEVALGPQSPGERFFDKVILLAERVPVSVVRPDDVAHDKWHLLESDVALDGSDLTGDEILGWSEKVGQEQKSREQREGESR